MRHRKRAYARAAAALAWLLWQFPVAAQGYGEVEDRVRREIEGDRAAALGDCSEVMVSWLGMRFTEEEQRLNRPHQACAAAQRFAFRNGVEFTEALPKVAAAMGGTRTQVCPTHAIGVREYMLYSGCRLPPEQWVPPPPDAWEVARQEEVRLLGPEALRHIRRCVPRAGVGFAFNVRADGRVSAFNDAGEWGRIGPSPEDARELARIERALLTDPRCQVFPEQLRGRYVSVAAGSGRMEIRQVRDDSAPGRAELPTNR